MVVGGLVVGIEKAGIVIHEFEYFVNKMSSKLEYFIIYVLT